MIVKEEKVGTICPPFAKGDCEFFQEVYLHNATLSPKGTRFLHCILCLGGVYVPCIHMYVCINFLVGRLFTHSITQLNNLQY